MANPIKPDLSVSYKGRMPKKEGEKHRQAFFYYASLGPERSHQKVADHFGYSREAVKVWSSAFRWRERITRREREERDQLIAEKRQEILQTRRDLISLGRVLIGNAVRKATPGGQSPAEEVAKGGIELRNARDIRDLVNVLLSAINWDAAGGSGDFPPEEERQETGYNLVIKS
jgi:hypothetical protein